jgi:hypothetical protein
MNLALLDPFRRQLPDRIDSTIHLPKHFHPQAAEDPAPSEFHACFSVRFNRHGTYLAAGHGSGAVPIHEFASRTLSAMHLPPSDGIYKNGVTSISWSRNSRYMMIGSYGDSCISLSDNQHEFAIDRVLTKLREDLKNDTTASSSPYPNHHQRKNTAKDSANFAATEVKDDDDDDNDDDVQMKHDSEAVASGSGIHTSLRSHRILKHIIHTNPGSYISFSKPSTSISQPSNKTYSENIIIPVPAALGLSAQIHPSGRGGIACLQDGSLVLFALTSDHPFHSSDQLEESSSETATHSMDNLTYLVYLSSPTHVVEGDMKTYHILSASFDSHGQNIYATTQCGKLIGLSLHADLLSSFRLSSCRRGNPDMTDHHTFPKLFDKTFEIDIPGKIASYQVIVSRKRSMVLLNCKDSTLRLYDLQECWASNEVKPRFTFQDPISKCKWTSCDFSGDGEYVVGGCNNKEAGDKYELYFWNTATGVLIDQLLGPQVSLYDVSWHPTRSFVAVATSDGLLDLWGPRIDWTAFAPDFQALQKNVEYIEKEDEFDVVVDTDYDEEARRLAILDQLEEQAVVDVCSVDKVAAFSDSEDEGCNQFYFNTNIRSIKN